MSVITLCLILPQLIRYLVSSSSLLSSFSSSITDSHMQEPHCYFSYGFPHCSFSIIFLTLFFTFILPFLLGSSSLSYFVLLLNSLVVCKVSRFRSFRLLSTSLLLLLTRFGVSFYCGCLGYFTVFFVSLLFLHSTPFFCFQHMDVSSSLIHSACWPTLVSRSCT